MKRRYEQGPPSRPATPLSADRSAEDGSDPKEFFRSLAHSRGPGRKALQLCGQVQQALYWILGSEAGDEALALLEVVAVEPAPDSTRLLVTLKAPRDIPVAAALEMLQSAHKAIRSEVAASIHRRKAPDLIYRVVQ